MAEEHVVFDEIPVILMPHKAYKFQEDDLSLLEICYVNIKAHRTDGSILIDYQGYCNVRSVGEADKENFNFNYNQVSVIQDDQLDQSAIWIDAARSPNVFNCYGIPQVGKAYSLCEEHQINSYTEYNSLTEYDTLEQNNIIVTQNDFDDVQLVMPLEYEHTQSVQDAVENILTDYSYSDTNDEEYSADSGVVVTEEEDVISVKETRNSKKKKKQENQTVNNALEQLMASDPKSRMKPRKKILFTGRDPAHAETIQVINYEDSSECPGLMEVDNEVEIENTVTSAQHSRATSPESRKKKYQCDLCPQKLQTNSEFKEHRASHRQIARAKRPTASTTDQQHVSCGKCGKVLKGKQKYLDHVRAHGDPERECDICHKVLATKFTLRAHKKIHDRKFPCTRCVRTYGTAQELSTHSRKAHKVYMCTSCDFVTTRRPEFLEHNHAPEPLKEQFYEETCGPEEYIDYGDIGDNTLLRDITNTKIAKSQGNFTKTTVAKKRRKGKATKTSRTCDSCTKSFDRDSDLKRHLIEHVVRSELAKTPVNANGQLRLTCSVCIRTFGRVDKFKQHLREHANLTLYSCGICHKSFSDSSNFSKHKKIHGNNYYQCDYCGHKFSSKRQLINDIMTHIEKGSIVCPYCPKDFYFESTLKKHIINAHKKYTGARYRCKFCREYFSTLKEKWDHEWAVHSSRKVVADCMYCDEKFRKYADLKRHCSTQHDVVIPRAKRLLRKTN